MAGDDAAGNEAATAKTARGPRAKRKSATAKSASAPASNVDSSASSVKSLAQAVRKRKRRHRSKKLHSPPDLVPMGGNFSKSSDLLLSASTAANTHRPSFSSSLSPEHDNIASDDIEIPAMKSSNTNLGQNRLAKGFARSHSSPELNAISSNSRRPSKASLDSMGNTKHAAIEISDSDSDEDMEDSEGGMVVNLTSSGHSEVSDPGMDQSSEEEGEITHQFETELSISAANGNAGVSAPKLRLVDLDPDELEQQIKYAFYHLDRTRIDLHRPVICLGCMQEGHMATDCPEVNCAHCTEIGRHSSALCPIGSRCELCREKGHSEDACPTGLKVRTVPCDICGTLGHTEKTCSQRFFPQAQLTATVPARLWISCCICASKSHLVGDCPDADRQAAARWSLRSLDPTQIINLSLETGTRSLEREAESRGMRPSGLQIKGRAGLHRAGDRMSARLSDNDDENEPFLRNSVRPRQDPSRPQFKMGPYQPQRPQDYDRRYDRFEAPTSDRGYTAQGRDTWYATDSFGHRRRSRSPGASPHGDTWRASSRRSPSPRRYDGYRQDNGPPPSDYWQSHPSNNAFDRRSQSNHAARPQAPPLRDVKTQLPTRKGSNSNLLANSKKKNLSQPSSMIPGGQGGGQKKKGKSLKSTGLGPT